MSDRGAVIYSLLRHLRPIVLGSARRVESGMQGLGWTIGTRAVVEVLAESGPATVPQLGARLSLARQNVQRHVDELVRLGHADTALNPAHRRSVLIGLTPAGAKSWAELHAREVDQLASLVADCTDDEVAVAVRVLAALERDINSTGPTP